MSADETRLNENDTLGKQAEERQADGNDSVASESSAKAAGQNVDERFAQAGSQVDPTAEWKTKVAYLSAEIENMRKRFMREKSDVIRWANESLVRALLPVMDNLQLAIQASKNPSNSEADEKLQEHPRFSGLLKGLDMTVKHFEQTLEQAGVQPIKAVGEDFDPNFHEAMSQGSDPNFKDNQVISEMQRGYILNGRVIRPARVVVNKIAN